MTVADRNSLEQELYNYLQSIDGKEYIARAECMGIDYKAEQQKAIEEYLKHYNTSEEAYKTNIIRFFNLKRFQSYAPDFYMSHELFEDFLYIQNNDIQFINGIYAITHLELSVFVTNMSGLFRWVTDELFESLYLGDWRKFNTSNVRNMSTMFAGCKLNYLNLSHFDTSNVMDMSTMFYGAYIDVINFTNFNTANVKDMTSMFSGASIGEMNLKSFNTENVRLMTSMFSHASVCRLDLSSFSTEKVIDMIDMFKGSKFKYLNISNFNMTNVKKSDGMFEDCKIDKFVGNI